MKKLLEFQKKVGVISKDSTNPFYKSKYFDINKLLEEIKPILSEEGLIVSQPLRNVEGKPAIGTLIIDSETGEKLIDETITLPDIQDPQKMGSAITYYRRYGLQSALGLGAEDDDGNLAKPAPKQTQNQVDYTKLLKSAKTLQQLSNIWVSIDGKFKTSALTELKDELKQTLK